MQVKLLSRPLQVPSLYSVLSQVVWLQVRHFSVLVLPLHVPVWNLSGARAIAWWWCDGGVCGVCVCVGGGAMPPNQHRT